MKTGLISARLAALALAPAAAFPSFSQTPDSSQLRETVVRASRFSEGDTALTFGVSVISAADIRKSGVSTVNEAISRLLGVPARLDLFGGGNHTLDLRGFGTSANSNQVVVLDGLRLNEADLSGPALSGIPVDSIERIEVLRGNGAVLYGEGATGGVIVITTKAGQGLKRANSAQVYGALGSYGLRDSSASATIAGGGFSVDVAANRRSADNHRDNFRSEMEGASLTGQWSNDWLRLGLRYGRDALESGLPGSLSAAQYAANPRQASTPFNRGSIDNERHGVFAEAVLGDWQLVADAGERSKTSVSRSPSYVYQYSVKASTAGLRARHEGKGASLSNVLLLGLENNDWTRQVAGAGGTLSHADSRAYYLKDDVTLLATGTRLSLGLRTEQLSKDVTPPLSRLQDRQQAWDLGLSQPLGQQLTVYGRVGRSFRLANADEFSFTTPLIAIRPQRSKDIELGTRWISGAGKAEIRAYRSDLSDEIGYDPQFPNPASFSGFGANVNFDPTRRQGLEFELSHALSPAVDLRANAGLRQAVFRSGAYAGKDVPLTPRRTLGVQADWQVAAAHRLSGGLNWVASQHPDFANACSMPAYASANARYAYRFRNAEFSLGVTNLADRKFYSQAFTCAAAVTGGIYPEAGRAVTAALRLSF
jgi:iron complex outermembrane receptor protein